MQPSDLLQTMQVIGSGEECWPCLQVGLFVFYSDLDRIEVQCSEPSEQALFQLQKTIWEEGAPDQLNIRLYLTSPTLGDLAD
jgi:hypothetical protein